ncbi:DNA-binding MarR family transcriptional regulator [Phyllobacterium myrsinacearum]|uniref:MarR family winged helix-turn-helix transcriptional regulator n=1 Tax=Phyllobacterium myrsinacearum TaxID=28101 RepID=UPI00102940E0|nr:MarR family winged helix-turn-helix transcriptional regulator [Phyllobacterium myrsinacearum]RZS76712.1 DNA-binding MarR family transcriptional regulator [Phyllobacterium myrsinacearum]
MKQPQITQTHWDVRSDRMAAKGQRSIPSVAGSAAHESAAGTVHAGPSPDGDIRDLFSFELQRLAGLSTRIAALSIRPKYGITAREWRALAVLKYLGKVPLQELAKHSGLLKSQMSRTVSAMIERGYIEKTANPGDGRSILLCLSAEGLDLSEQILDDSFERNEHMLSTLSQAERHMLIELLQRVTRSSTQYYHHLKQTASQADLQQLDEE